MSSDYQEVSQPNALHPEARAGEGEPRYTCSESDNALCMAFYRKAIEIAEHGAMLFHPPTNTLARHYCTDGVELLSVTLTILAETFTHPEIEARCEEILREHAPESTAAERLADSRDDSQGED